jgi:hypothetical protein
VKGIETKGIPEKVMSEISYHAKRFTVSTKYVFARENLLGDMSVAAIERETSKTICTGVAF